MKKIIVIGLGVFLTFMVAGCSTPASDTATNVPTQVSAVTSTPSTAKTDADFKEECKTEFDYNAFMNNVDGYDQEMQYFDAEVLQIIDGELAPEILFMYKGDSDRIVFTMKVSELPDFAEGDNVRVYGKVIDTYTYETVDGDDNTVPMYSVFAIDVLQAAPTQKAFYGLIETAPIVVDGEELGDLTINKVSTMKDRNQFAEEDPAQVVLIEYTYKNTADPEEMYIFDAHFQVIDEGGTVCETYPNSKSKYPKKTPIGAKCTAQAIFGLETSSSKITINYKHNMFDDYSTITFKVPVS
jgi:hypothetical protein